MTTLSQSRTAIGVIYLGQTADESPPQNGRVSPRNSLSRGTENEQNDRSNSSVHSSPLPREGQTESEASRPSIASIPQPGNGGDDLGGGGGCGDGECDGGAHSMASAPAGGSSFDGDRMLMTAIWEE